jgi:hypothetical protein
LARELGDMLLLLLLFSIITNTIIIITTTSPFVETSALSGSNVDSVFVVMTSRIKKSVDRRGLGGVKVTIIIRIIIILYNNKMNPSHVSSVGGVEFSSREKKKSSCGCS